MKETFLDGPTFIFICLFLSGLRIYLEFIKFDFSKLVLVKFSNQRRREKINKFGFYMSFGYFVLFAPDFLLNQLT